VSASFSKHVLLIQMRKTKPATSTARFWTILAAVNVLGIGYVVGLNLRADGSDEQLFAAMALIFVVFFAVIADIVSVVLACELWAD
jgi:hypothetical protein